MKYIKMFEKVVKELYYNANGLGTLPKLPKTLIKLYCYGNRLTELPELPNGLEELYCSDNKLTKLPELPKSLRILSCYDNNLEKLTELPSRLEYLSFDYNILIKCPIILPVTLKELFCKGNDAPFKNLAEYNEWLNINHPEVVNANKFNI